MNKRTQPDHWIWRAELPPLYPPDEAMYHRIRGLLPPEDIQMVEEMIREGMTAEQLMLIFAKHYPHNEPAHMEAFGQGLAAWVQHLRPEETR